MAKKWKSIPNFIGTNYQPPITDEDIDDAVLGLAGNRWQQYDHCFSYGYEPWALFDDYCFCAFCFFINSFSWRPANSTPATRHYYPRLLFEECKCGRAPILARYAKVMPYSLYKQYSKD